MTLGGLAIAIGELVDDSIVDVENIFRRLKENRRKHTPDNLLKVIFLASCEIRNSVVYATSIVVLVVLPLFSLAGLEGRMFAPMGLSYMLTLLASLVVSLTVTPVLASYILPRAKLLQGERDPFVLRWLKWLDTFALRSLSVTASPCSSSWLSLSFSPFPRSFGWGASSCLPSTRDVDVSVTAPPATSLEESNRLGKRVEEILKGIPEVTHVSRRTGRAELDEHAENVNFSEVDVGLAEPEHPSRASSSPCSERFQVCAGSALTAMGDPEKSC